MIESDYDEFDNIQSNTEGIQKQNIDIKKEVINQERRSSVFSLLIDTMLYLNLSIRHQTQYLLVETIQKSYNFYCNQYWLRMNFHDGKCFKFE